MGVVEAIIQWDKEQADEREVEVTKKYIFTMREKGLTDEQISEFLDISLEQIQALFSSN